MLATILLLALPKYAATFPVSPDGLRFIKLHESSGVLKVVDAKTGKEKRELIGCKFKPYVVQFSPDGSKVAASNTLGEVCLWVVDSGKLVFKVTDADTRRRSAYIPLLFSPDSQSLVAANLSLTSRTLPEIDATPDKAILSFWNAKTGKKITEVRTNNDWPVSQLLFVNKGRTLRVLSLSITDFEWPSGKLEGSEWPWQFYSMSEEGSLAGEYPGHWIDVWDVATRKRMFHVKDTNLTPVEKLVFAPDNKSFAMLRKRTETYADTGRTLFTAELWSYPEGTLLWKTPEASHNMLRFSPDGTSIILPNLQIRRVPSGEVLGTFKDTEWPVLGKGGQWRKLPAP